METERGTQTFFSRETLYLIFKYKWLLAAIINLCVMFAVVFSLTQKREYEAFAKVLVKLGREQSVNMVGRNETYFSVNMRSEDINTEIEIIKSPDILRELVEKRGPYHYLYPAEEPNRFLALQNAMLALQKRLLGAFRSPEPQNRELATQKAVEALGKKLRVEQILNSDVIEVRYRAPTPREAADTVNELLVLFLDKHIAVHSDKGIHELLTRQAANSKAELDLIEQRLESLRANVSTRPPSGQAGASSRSYEAQNAETVGAMERRLLDLEFERKRLLGQYTRDSQIVIELENQIAEVGDMLRQERRRFAAKTKEYEELDRQRRIAEERAVLFQRQLDEARIQEAMDRNKIVSVHVISQAVPPLRPKGGGLAAHLVVSLGLAFMMCALLVVFLNYTDDTFHEETRIEGWLKVPVTASVPHMPRLQGDTREI